MLLIERRGQRQTVVHACGRAMAAGVSGGMALGDARAILPPGGVRIELHDPARIGAKLHAIALWATRFSPTVAPDPPDGLLLDVTGCERVWKGEGRLRGAVVESLRGLGVEARVAVAPTLGAAWALARFGERRTAQPDDTRAVLAPLPVEALRLEPETVEDLRSLGIERVEHLLALPRRTLPARFGASVLLRLDQAMGEAIETIEPVRATDPVKAERVFEGSTTRWDAIERTVRDLLGELCVGLRTREVGALRVEAELRRADLPPAVIVAALSRPSRDARHLWSVLRPKLERTHLGFGVEGVSIVASRAVRIPHEQRERWRSEDPERGKREGELLDSLAARLGPDRVARACLVESHIPERAARWSGVLAPTPEAVVPTDAPKGARPTVLLALPEEAQAVGLTPDGPVLTIAWGGEVRRVARCVGPERVGPEWWAGDRETRDYFKLQDERGRWVWAYREHGTRRWFVHGVWA